MLEGQISQPADGFINSLAFEIMLNKSLWLVHKQTATESA